MENMQTFILGIVVVSVVLVVGIYILTTIGATFTANTAAANASAGTVTALAGGVPWITILVVVGFAVIVLAMLMYGFSRAGGAGGAAGGAVY